MSIPCKEIGCRRVFVTEQALHDHAAVVHFEDIRTLVQDALKDAYPSAFAVDFTSTDVIFDCQGDGERYSLFRCSYEISGSNEVTLGDPSEVIRIVTYEDKPNGGMPATDTPEGMGDGLMDMEDD